MLGSLTFLIHECWLNIRRQGLLVLACVSTTTVSLTILGAFVLMAWHVHSIADAIPRRFEVHAFMEKSATRDQTQALMREIRDVPGVAQVRLVTREQAWAEFKDGYAHKKDLEGLTENPLPDKLEIVAATPEKTLAVADAVRKMAHVDEVREGREVLRKLLSIANVVRIAGIALALLLALGTAAIISNAIRMTLYARRRDIRVMQLVGATNSFIRLPFLMEGMVEGALGGALACALMALGLQYLSLRVLPDLAFVNEFRMTLNLPVFCGTLIAGGALLGSFGSLFSMRKFLRAV
jgi:cell division transport system permease protein